MQSPHCGLFVRLLIPYLTDPVRTPFAIVNQDLLAHGHRPACLQPPACPVLHLYEAGIVLVLHCLQQLLIGCIAPLLGHGHVHVPV